MQNTRPAPCPASLAAFDCHDPEFAAETALATVWKVICRDGTPAAMKVYKSGMRGEAPGFALMHCCAGVGAAKIYAVREGAALLEWLDGPSLGDLVRAGEDVFATETLLEVALQLHSAAPTAAGLKLVPLRTSFDDLFAARIDPDCPAAMVATLRRAMDVAGVILDAARGDQPLHGDLHHDNIKRGSRGWCAFDSKGLTGDPLYDVANAFRNPVGAEDVYQDPAVIVRRARVWAAGSGTTVEELLR